MCCIKCANVIRSSREVEQCTLIKFGNVSTSDTQTFSINLNVHMQQRSWHAAVDSSGTLVNSRKITVVTFLREKKPKKKSRTNIRRFIVLEMNIQVYLHKPGENVRNFEVYYGSFWFIFTKLFANKQINDKCIQRSQERRTYDWVARWCRKNK